ncbi:MAG: toll/interleukin-1 receptor domain-containing protein [Thermodesulfobacteriota bacterium]|nr:toll/interleukin-1 receptor domain-containing protein [Thermodesulfobacteriota bacterium]
MSHDSRDKDEVARKIATKLQSMLCPVWYDEFTLKIGDNLRDSIEKGLKECKKCILILSPNFLSNKGWTKKEFDSIFTREIMEEQKLVLPVWYGVTKEDVYAYSPSLLNIKGANWDGIGEKEVCRQLYNAIMS